MGEFQIPDQLRRALAIYEEVCLITEIDHQAAILAKVPAREQASFRGAPVKYWYELGLFENGPVLCLAMEVLDDPDRPYAMETFLDVNKPADLALAEKLAQQTHLIIHFVDEQLGYTFSKQLRHRQRRELVRMIQQALKHLERVDKPDWYAARQQFMQEVQR